MNRTKVLKVFLVITVIAMFTMLMHFKTIKIVYALNGSVHEVYPTGNPALDVPSVGAAIAGAASGDTVLFKATDSNGDPQAFNFGAAFAPCGFEGKSLTLRGETVNGAMTTFLGGMIPVRVPRMGVPTVNNPHDVTIEGIHFRNAIAMSVAVLSCRNMTIKNNKFTEDTMAGKTVYNAPFGRQCGWAIFAGYITGRISGDVRIEGNEIDLEEDLDPNTPPTNPDYCTLGIDLRFTYPTSHVSISNNTIRNPSGCGIYLLTNAGSRNIERNVFELGPYGAYLFGLDFASATAIFALNWPPCPGSGTLNIYRNTITCAAENKAGIAVAGFLGCTFSDGSSIIENDITCQDCLTGGFIVDISKCAVLRNRVVGSYDRSVLSAGSENDDLHPLPTEFNTFVANNIVRADSDTDVYLASDTNNIVLVGYSGTVTDNGTDNQITGFTPVYGGVGDAVSEVMVEIPVDFDEQENLVE